MFQQRHDEAIRLARRERAEHPGSKDARLWLGIALVQSGQHEEGLRVLEEVVAAVPNSPFHQALFGWVCGRAGKANKARELLQRLETIRKSRYVSGFVVARVHASCWRPGW